MATRFSSSTFPCKAPALIPSAVTRHAVASPTAPAIIGDQETWTYADLDARVRALHERLRHAGVLHGDRVIVALDRGPDLVAALLAVSRAGATYVPVDPAHPPARIEAVTAQAAPRVAFADGVGYAALPENLEVIRSDEPLLLDRVSPSPVPVFPESAAYMLFTSGSTGRPKGVVIPHRALEAFIPAVARRLDMTSTDRVLAATTIGFDISVLEIFVPLVLGATVDLVSAATRGHPGRLAAYLDQRPINVVQATPTGFRLLIEAGWKGRPGTKILCGGEAMTPELAGELLARGGEGGEVWNMYGPTECTVWATTHRITADAPTPYLGTALDGTRLTIVDPEGHPTDDGELIIAGPQVGTGYFRNPVKTDAAFIADAEAPDRLAYRTGDRVTRTEHGLVFRGRLDSQVKVRGVRIELGEVEAALLGHPAVAQCAVLLDDDREELDAYLVAAPEQPAPTPEALRTHLEPTTYAAAWPARYVWLETMPLTATGKIDRKALPALAPPVARTAGGGEPPATDLEWLVAKAWRQVLRLSHDPSRQDGFVSLGGTSRKGLEVVLRLERWIEVDIPTATFMACRTVAEQAALLDEARGTNAALNAVRLSDGDGSPLFAICGVQLYFQLAKALEGIMPVYGVSVPLERVFYETDAEPPTVEMVADEVEAAIRAVQPRGPYRLGGASFAGVVAYEVARRLQAAGELVEVVIPFDSCLPDALRSSAARRLALFVRDLLRKPIPVDPTAPRTQAERWNDGTDRSTARYLAALSDRPTVPLLVIRATVRAEGRGQWVDRDLGWSSMTRLAPVVREAPGDHLGILTGDGASACAAAIREFIETVAPRAASSSAKNDSPDIEFAA